MVKNGRNLYETMENHSGHLFSYCILRFNSPGWGNFGSVPTTGNWVWNLRMFKILRYQGAFQPWWWEGRLATMFAEHYFFIFLYISFYFFWFMLVPTSLDAVLWLPPDRFRYVADWSLGLVLPLWPSPPEMKALEISSFKSRGWMDETSTHFKHRGDCLKGYQMKMWGSVTSIDSQHLRSLRFIKISSQHSSELINAHWDPFAVP